MLLLPTIRVDDAGDGHFGALRGDRTHCGVDYESVPGSVVLSPFPLACVVRWGYPYAGDSEYRLILLEVDDILVKIMYVDPLPEPGERLRMGDRIGVVQDVTQRYPGQRMKPHIHVEARYARNGRLIDYSKILEQLI